jgi:hypothetical protein
MATFKPYLLKTTDGGKTWKSIAATLPERGSVYTIAEDHVDRNLLFCGTEFGVFFSPDGGDNWVQLKSDCPPSPCATLRFNAAKTTWCWALSGAVFMCLTIIPHCATSMPRLLIKNDRRSSQSKIPGCSFQTNHLGLRDKGHLGSSYYAAPIRPWRRVYLLVEG